jgi:hypothetical protein
VGPKAGEVSAPAFGTSYPQQAGLLPHQTEGLQVRKARVSFPTDSWTSCSCQPRPVVTNIEPVILLYVLSYRPMHEHVSDT